MQRAAWWRPVLAAARPGGAMSPRRVAQTLMDGLAFCLLLVPDVRRCYENIEGSRLMGRRETAAQPLIDDHHPCIRRR